MDLQKFEETLQKSGELKPLLDQRLKRSTALLQRSEVLLVSGEKSMRCSEEQVRLSRELLRNPPLIFNPLIILRRRHEGFGEQKVFRTRAVGIEAAPDIFRPF